MKKVIWYYNGFSFKQFEDLVAASTKSCAIEHITRVHPDAVIVAVI